MFLHASIDLHMLFEPVIFIYYTESYSLYIYSRSLFYVTYIIQWKIQDQEVRAQSMPSARGDWRLFGEGKHIRTNASQQSIHCETRSLKHFHIVYTGWEKLPF